VLNVVMVKHTWLHTSHVLRSNFYHTSQICDSSQDLINFFVFGGLTSCHWVLEVKELDLLTVALVTSLLHLLFSIASVSFSGRTKLYYVKDYLSPKDIADKGLSEILGAMEVADSQNGGRKKQLLCHLWPDTNRDFATFFNAFRREVMSKPNSGGLQGLSFFSAFILFSYSFVSKTL